MSSLTLLRTRRFAPLFVTQFLGAFNDNVLKNALVVFITFQAVAQSQSAADSAILVNVATGLFVLPFFLFSATAGQLADKYEKAGYIRYVKLAEVGIMVLAAIGFAFGSVYGLIGLLFLMGTQSTFFGPVKYAILPQHLPESELVAGNGLIEMGTFLAILLGTLLGGFLIEAPALGPVAVGGCLILFAVAGWWSSRQIPKAPSFTPDLKLNWNIPQETWRLIQSARENRTVFNAILGISWFWAYGFIFLAQLPAYVKDVLGGDGQVFTLLLATFSFGIGLGAMLCARLSGRLIELGLVPIGAIGLTVFALDLVLASDVQKAATLVGPGTFLADIGNWRVLVDLALIAIFGGLFIVPLYALIQHRSEESERARIVAANNILNAFFMVMAALVTIALLARGLTIPHLLLVVALANAAVAIYIFTLVPEFLMRFIVWMLIHTIYRLRIEGIENLPDEGPVVITSNHVSFVDALVLTAACRRPIRFIMDHRIFKTPILNFVFRTNRCIPIASRKVDPTLVDKAFDDVAAGLEAGDVIGIFPEGKITYDGEFNPFRPGVEQIVERTPVPVVPMALSGLWGSFFSRDGGEAMSRPMRLLRRFRSEVVLRVGEPILPADLNADELQAITEQLRVSR
ncbi:MAG: MFS transporter [Pseudomonadota bacterium]